MIDHLIGLFRVQPSGDCSQHAEFCDGPDEDIFALAEGIICHDALVQMMEILWICEESLQLFHIAGGDQIVDFPFQGVGVVGNLLLLVFAVLPQAFALLHRGAGRIVQMGVCADVDVLSVQAEVEKGDLVEEAGISGCRDGGEDRENVLAALPGMRLLF